MKIASLLPSSTEIVYALGLGDQLVAVSHECDYPPEARMKPKMTRALIDSHLPSAAIDDRVRKELHGRGSLYDLDLELLNRVQPDLILTQQLCSVCAVSFDYVQEAVKQLVRTPQVVNLEPMCLNDILENILTVGKLTGRLRAAEAFVQSLRRRVERLRALVGGFSARPKTFLMEWIDPPFCGGHWNGELIEMAGGVDRMAKAGQPSRRVSWEEIAAFAPEIVVMSCCGFSVERTLKEIPVLDKIEGWKNLPGVRDARVYIADGNQYFSRPGPRIVDSLEMLAVMIHPELAAHFSFPEEAFRKL